MYALDFSNDLRAWLNTLLTLYYDVFVLYIHTCMHSPSTSQMKAVTPQTQDLAKHIAKDIEVDSTNMIVCVCSIYIHML